MVIAIRTNNADKLILLLIKLINCCLIGLESHTTLCSFLYGRYERFNDVRPGLLLNEDKRKIIFDAAKVAQRANPTKLIKHL